MESTSSYTIPQNLNTYIADYNQASPGEKKNESLNKIHDIVSQFLEKNKSSADIQALGKELKAVRWYEDDLAIRSQILGEIEARLPAAATAAPQLISDIYSLIANETDRKTIANLLRSNKGLKKSLTQPKALADFLTKFSHELSPQTKFALALRCGKALTHLDLSKFKGFNDAMLQQLTQACPKLQSLNLSGTFIQRLNHLPKGLKELNLSHCDNLPSEEFEKLTNDSFPKLEKLNLTWTNIKRVDHLSKSLKELDLSHCTDLTPEAFEQLTSNFFPRLEKLNLSWTLLKRVDHLSKSLKELHLIYCSDLTPEAFEQLTDDSFPTLEKLNLSWNNIERVDHLPKSLKELHLSCCNNLPAEAFEQLTDESFPKLEKLNLRGTEIGGNLLPKRLQAVRRF